MSGLKGKTNNCCCKPERGHSLGALFGWKGPTLLVAGQSPGPGTHLCLLAGHFCPLPCMLHCERSDPKRDEKNEETSRRTLQEIR